MNNQSRTLKNLFKIFVNNITTLSGVRHLTGREEKRTIVWKVLLTVNIILTVLFIVFVTNRYNEDKVVTVINSNCKVSQVPFPAVNICNFNIISLRESKNIIMFLKRYNYSQENIETFLKDLRHLKDFGIISSKVNHHKKIIQLLKDNYFTMDSIMEDSHQKCEDLLVFCSFNRKVKKCTDLFQLTKTYEGFCCSFNYAGPDDDGNDGSMFSEDDHIEYFKDTSDDPTQAGRMIATSETGRTSGLYVIFNVEPEDYPPWIAFPFHGAKIILSTPYDYPETTTRYEYVQAGDQVDMKLVPQILQTEAGVRSLSPATRSCWFHDEVTLKRSSGYSHENCRTECKVSTFIKLCGCVPYKYPAEESVRVCELEDMACLNNIRTFLSEDRRVCQPKCYMECNDVRYILTTDTVPFMPPPSNLNITSNMDARHLSSLRIYYMRSLCTCYRLKLLIDFNYILAIFGGILQLSFGGSMISIIELSYLFLSMILSIIWDNIYALVLNIWRRYKSSKVYFYT